MNLYGHRGPTDSFVIGSLAAVLGIGWLALNELVGPDHIYWGTTAGLGLVAVGYVTRGIVQILKKRGRDRGALKADVEDTEP